jgi:hypothetical protein
LLAFTHLLGGDSPLFLQHGPVFATNHTARLQRGLGDKTTTGVHGCVQLNIHHKSTRSPLLAKLRVRHGHVQLLTAGNVSLVPLRGAGNGAADANTHHQDTGQKSR